MTDTAPPALRVFDEPTRRVPGRWIAGFAIAWLGIWMAQLTPVQLLLPGQIDALRPQGDGVESVVTFGIISGIAGVFALVSYPLAGALSDRTTSRFGRRRPWIVGGAILFGLALGVLGLQTTMVGIGICWVLVIVGFCVLTAALTAMISDQVPVGQRGVISAWISAPQAVGLILGVLLVIALELTTLLGYGLVAVLLIALVMPFVIVTPDARLAAGDRPPFTMRALVGGFWVSPRRYPDFAWTLLGRILVNIGNALGTTLLLFFLIYGLGREDADTDLLILIVVYTVFIVGSSFIIGAWSDRIARRKPFVVFSAGMQAVAALLLAFVPDFTVALVASAFLGLGYGAFLSVDQALATQVLPDAASRGKDLGIMNIATTVPQAMAPLLGAGIVALVAGATGAIATGFVGLFVVSGLITILGALAVLPVKAVR
ncbi:MFS transporter [Pseudolysinimonas yzui]|uniref:MFS transporter n=1 Tax=Pseudolysinimonas yzui TaxID=2708254 RepID=A0A8J3M1U2_9MICO|nr:MFS transporter [Pseudolysinimonas yzui]GHF18657.1 MFS transporter [Pseudolysinimonas yzui]